MNNTNSRPGAGWPHAVVFDLDGTLVNSAPDIASSLNMLGIEEGWRDFPLEEVRRMVGGGIPKLMERTLAALGLPVDPREVSILAGRFMELYAPRATEETRLYPGAKDLLDALSADGIRLAVCTNKPEAISRDILAALGVEALFGAVVGGDSGFPKKPDPAPLRAALGMLGVTPGDAVMVGDSGADARAASGAGVRLVLVSYGYTQTPVSELPADAHIDSLAEVPDVLRRMAEAGAA